MKSSFNSSDITNTVTKNTLCVEFSVCLGYLQINKIILLLHFSSSPCLDITVPLRCKFSLCHRCESVPTLCVWSGNAVPWVCINIYQVQFDVTPKCFDFCADFNQHQKYRNESKLNLCVEDIDWEAIERASKFVEEFHQKLNEIGFAVTSEHDPVDTALDSSWTNNAVDSLAHACTSFHIESDSTIAELPVQIKHIENNKRKAELLELGSVKKRPGTLKAQLFTQEKHVCGGLTNFTDNSCCKNKCYAKFQLQEVLVHGNS